FKNCKIPIIALGWSDPNMFNEVHFNQGTIYCTNDLTLSHELKGKPIYFYNTACDKRHHIDLKLKKETDILVYGVGKHPFVPNRNKVVNNLRRDGFSVKVFGRNWDSHKDTYDFIEGEGLSCEICKAHILLDVTNKETAWGHRVFESSARGTPVLTIDREDTRSMFEPDSEIVLYKNYNDMKEKLTFYLKSKEILREIGINAQKRCYKDHDISIKIKELIKIIGDF
ncbi:MAG: glycosyltransferase, partial [Novosphingobium sp.]|nr:glycosyltransferase [Novosphingobium sp.]